MHKELFYGFRLSRGHRAVLYPDDGLCGRLRPAGRKKMTWLYVLCAIIAAGLLGYLIVALLNPEDFS